MRELLPELLEPLLVIAYAVIVTALALLGIGAELVGLAGLGGGVNTVSLWYVYVGGVGLAAAAVVARRRLLPRLADLA